jgi:hypothetical protein
VRAVLLAYTDESYDAATYWIAALICTEDQVSPIMEALDEVVEEASDNYSGVRSTAELHGYSLFHGTDDWQALHQKPRARIGIYAKAFQAVADVDPKVIIRGVDVVRLNRRYVNPWPPHSVVLQHLLERIDEYAQVRRELALVIADELDEAAYYRRQLWEFQRSATPGYRSRQLTRILDTIHFAPSHASRLLQAVDLIAFLHKRIASGCETDPRAKRANDALWDRIAPCVRQMECWTPR